jgi:hypothetical protein
MMNQDLKTRWLAALRSGAYKQGQGGLLLRADNLFCCLGVLADVIDPGGWDGDEDADFMAWGGRTDILPSGTAGLSAKWQTCLMQLNDGGESFAYIADVLEESDGN